MKYIIDIQDLWPEAFCMAVKNKWLQKLFIPMKKYIDYAYSNADFIAAVSQTYVDRALTVNKKINSGISVYLGNNTELFENGRSKYFIKRDDDEIRIGYVGSMGDSYDIGCIIDAIDIYQKSECQKKVRFVLCGDGEKRKLWEQLANAKGVVADFMGAKPYDEMAGILCSCDIVVNPIVQGSAASIINKVGDYALSGLPVINTQESPEYRKLVEQYQCGINCECGNSQDVANALTTLISNEELRLLMGKNHRKMGEERFSRDNTYKALADTVVDGTNGKIIIIANFPASLDGKANGRFTYLAEMLAANGQDVEVITSTFNHAHKKNDNKVTGNYKSKITLIPEPGYSKNISLKRLYSHWVWGRNVRKYLDSLETKPAVVYCAIPSLTAAVQAAKYCKRGGEVKFLIDIQDVWPEAFYMLSDSTWLPKAFKPIKWYINKAYSSADVILGVSETYINIGAEVNHKAKTLCVYLGNNKDLFDKGKNLYYQSHLENEIWIAYIGTMGYSYDIPCVIDAIKKAQNILGNRVRLKFVAMGTGPLLEHFKQLAQEAGIYNEFTGSLPYQEMVGKMCSCDIVINPINKGAAQSITNKVGDYALSGLPVINTQENEEYRNLVSEYNCGINCECGNSNDVADAIVKLTENDCLRKLMGDNARKLGEERFDRKITYPKIISSIKL